MNKFEGMKDKNMKIMKNYKSLKKLRKSAKGITLIALVITIIVLLILAGVSIATLTGDNGILTRAQEAKNKTDEESAKEQINLEILASLDSKGKYTNNILKENLEKHLGAQVKLLSDNKLRVDYKGYQFIIDSNGNVQNIFTKVKDENPGVMEGKGELENPYVINSMEDLVSFANATRKDGNQFNDKYVELGCSLDFNSDISYSNLNTLYSYNEEYKIYEADETNGTVTLKELLSSGNGWMPIDNFYGFFDGKDNIIKGMYICFNADSYDFTGLFRNNYGTIKNLSVDNLSISVVSQTNYSFVGGICGNNSGSIISCYTSGNINSNYENSILGGICGVANTNSNIENCGSNVNITGKSIQCGGVVGQNNSTVEKSYNKGNIHMDYARYVGGIVGLGNSLDTNIISCYNNGDLKITDSEEEYFRLGGIVGQQNAGVINSCYNTGDIYAKSSINDCRIGGICGLPSTTWLYALYNLGDITAKGVEIKISGIGQVSNGRSIKGAYNEREIFYDYYENVAAISYGNYENYAGVEDIFYYCSLDRAFKIEHPNESIFKLTSPIDKSELLKILNNTGHGKYFVEDINKINDGYPILNWQ